MASEEVTTADLEPPPPAAMNDGLGAVVAGFPIVGIDSGSHLTDILQRVP